MATDDTAPVPDTAPTPQPLRWLERVPRVAIFIAVLVIALAVLWTPGIAGAVLTTLVAAVAALLLYATWPQHTATTTRLVRVLVVAVFAVSGIVKFFV